ncbi:uncharacterized protein LOC121896596 isoform X2 [Scomber scombrus]|uniref:Uncharacterized protein LOC121896596 isoform X2 n=1 Tax=Scomber scombrus TaxID=13677 RepID=A0AAV1PR01_SCOSC
MTGRGDGSHNGGNGPQFHTQFTPSGDFAPVNLLHGEVLAWLDLLEDIGLLDVGFGVGLHAILFGNDDIIHNNDVEDIVNNDEDIGNNNVSNIGNVDNADNNVAVEDAGVEENQGVPGDPLPGPSRRRSGEVDVANEGFQWWDEFADSTGDDFEEGTGMNPAQEAGADVEDPLPGGSRKSSREDEEERDSKKSRRCAEFTDINSDTVLVKPCHDHSDSSNSDHCEDAVEEFRNQPVEDEDPQPGRSKKRSREDDEEEDKRGAKESRWWAEFTDSDTVSVEPLHDHSDSSNSDHFEEPV